MADGMLHELQRQLDAFVTSYEDLFVKLLKKHDAAVVDTDLRLQTDTSSTTASLPSSHAANHDSEAAMNVALGRLQWMSATFASRSLCEVVQLLLSWTSAIDSESTCSSSTKRLASWLSAHLIAFVFEELSDTTVNDNSNTRRLLGDANAVNAVTELVLDKCFSVFHEYSQNQSHSETTEPATSFFAFKPTQHQHLKQPLVDMILTERMAAKWRCVLSWVSTTHSLTAIRVRVQSEIAKPTLLSLKPSGHHHDKEHPFVKHLALMRLGIASHGSNSLVATDSQPPLQTFTQRLKDAALFLKTLQPLLAKPTKSYIRLGIFSLVARILKRELLQMDTKCAQQVYTTAHAGEWNSCLSDLHALAMKSASKKREFVAVGWELRVAVLCIAPNDIFSRYWKDDVHSLLRLQYQHNKDGTSGGTGTGGTSTLDCIGFCFSQLLQRHFLIERRMPSESDCMEIINTTQAWCFFSSHRHKSFQNFKTQVLPVLVRITVDIASYNMTYAVQSHLRRLLTEAESIFDEKKLVGLESLVAICRHCLSASHGDVGAMKLDKKALAAHRKALGDLVGHILIECNTSLGHELLIDTIGVSSSSLGGHTASGSGSMIASLAQPSSTANLSARFLRDDFKHSLAIQTFGAALCSLEFLCSALELSEDQKMMLIARASVHAESYVRECAARALHCIVTSREKPQGATVFRGLTDFVLRMTGNQANASDMEACTILVRLLGCLLQATTEASKCGYSCWENRRARDESLLQVDAVCVYLLVNDDMELRKCVLTTLETVQEAMLVEVITRGSDSPLDTENSSRRCVLAAIEAMESELQHKFFSFLPEEELQCIQRDPGVSSKTTPAAAKAVFFRHLACGASFPRHSFRWAMCLSMLFARLARKIPEVTIYIWSDVNDKILKLEPVIPVLNGESESGSGIARWRNLSILATASACPSLIASGGSGSSSQYDDGSNRSQQQDSISTCGGSVQSLISSSAIVSLFKRLGKYIKSPSMEQRKAAILALGSTNPSAFSILVEVLGKYESEAFAVVGGGSDGAVQQVQSSANSLGMSTSSSSATPATSASLASHWRQSRMSKVKYGSKPGGQSQLLWAIGRCFRLLLEKLLLLTNQYQASSRSHLERFLLGVRGFLDRLSVVLETKAGKSTESANLQFMMQQDFCASVRAFLRYTSRVASTNPDTQELERSQPGGHSQSSVLSKASSLSESDREKLFYLVMSWCPSVGVLATSSLTENLESTGFFKITSPLRLIWMQHADVFGGRYDEYSGGGEHMHWLDDADLSVLLNNGSSASKNSNSNQATAYQWYFLCSSVFAVMAALLEHGATSVFLSPPIVPDAPVFRWLDECFCVDASSSFTEREEGANFSSSSTAGFPHFKPLQRICSQALEALLVRDFATFGPICIEKALFTQPQGDKFTISKHYFRAVSDKIAEFEKPWTSCGSADGNSGGNSQQLLARFFHAAILHIGVEDDEDHRVVTLNRLTKLINSPGIIPSAISIDPATDLSLLLRQHGYSSYAAKSLPVLITQVMSRVQLAMSSLLASRFPDLAFALSASLLRFISFCDVTQQRKLFAVALPWLAEIELTMPGSIRTSSDDSASEYNSHQLLSLLFRLTKNLSSSCGDQLEHAWLTLAFTSQSSQQQHHDSGEETTDPASPSNLAAIIRFLFFQRASNAHLATSKTVFWWLSRWQSTAAEVIGVLVDLVVAQRRRTVLGVHSSPPPLPQPSETRRGSFADDTAALQNNPLNDVVVLLTLLSDSSCNLLTPGQDTAALTEMALQIIHYAILMLFSSSVDRNHEASDIKKGNNSSCAGARRVLFEASDAHLYKDIARDCLLVLRNVLPLLQVSLGSLELFLDQLRHLEVSENQFGSQALESAVASFVQARLSSYEILIWSDECVKEVALAISFYASQDSRLDDTTAAPSSPAPLVGAARLQGTLCLRFALTLHRLLAAPFHGDVFLTLMELLHYCLDEQNRDPANANALVRDCLVALRAMVQLMPSGKLVLYPQILWVCMALLNHCKTRGTYHDAILDLLLELLSKPQFFTSAVLQDILMNKRPQQWSRAQCSVLRALALNAYSCAGRRALQLVAQAVTLNCPVLLADTHEHAVICTITLLPLLCAAGENSASCSHCCESLMQRSRLKTVAMGLADLWQAFESDEAFQLCQLFESYATSDVVSTSDTDRITNKELLVSCATAFSQLLRKHLESESTFDGLTVSLEILLNVVECCQQKCGHLESDHARQRESERRCVAHAALRLIEEMLKVLVISAIVWQMPPSLAASLVRLARELHDSLQWEVTVRIMSYVAASFSTVSSEIAHSKPHLSINKSEVSTTGSREGESKNQAPMTPKSPKTKVSAPFSVKKDAIPTARKFMNLMTRRTTSPSAKNNNGNGSAHPSNSNTNDTNNNSNSTSSCGSSSSIVGGHPGIEGGGDATSRKVGKPVDDPSEDDRPPATPTRSRTFRS